MRRKIAILILEENAIMINSLLIKQEQKKFNGGFCFLSSKNYKKS